MGFVEKFIGSKIKEEITSYLFDGTLPDYDTITNIEQNPMCLKKLYSPVNGWEWYVIEASEESGMLFGFVVGNYPEGGTFTFKELIRACAVPDYDYVPKPMDEIMAYGHQVVFGA